MVTLGDVNSPHNVTRDDNSNSRKQYRGGVINIYYCNK